MITEINGKKLDFHQMMEHSLSPKFLIKDTKIIYANKASLRLLKVEEASEILNQSYKKFLHPDFYEFSQIRLHKVLELKSTLKQVEIKIIDMHGKTIEVESNVGLYNFDGDFIVQVIMQDITEKKETLKLLMQSEKLSVMGELATGIVHEIRNPLTILKGFLHLIKNETTRKGTDYISIMTDELKRVEKIANDLLYFSKPHEKHIQNKNIITIIKDVIFLLDNVAFKRHISIDFYYEDEYIEINCDEVQLKQAFINFIKNAIEATPDKGNINVKIKKENQMVTISISDSGCGMTKEQVDRLGTSFFTTKENGTGLGLMVTYNIIKNHYGNINVTSEKGQGTTFHIDLPIGFYNNKPALYH